MPRKRPDADGNYIHATTRHFNVRCTGDFIFNRVTLRDLRELRLDIITSIWCVEEKRELTKAEIKKLCAGKC